MKTIMLSIRPKYVSMILNKTKTIEVRKRFPKDYKGWVYIYCTKDSNKAYHLAKAIINGKTHYNFGYKSNIESEKYKLLNGKVVARFYCDKVEEIYRSGSYLEYLGEEIDAFVTNELDNFKLLGCACLEEKEMGDYFESEYEACVGYAIHISNLEIFDKPKELSEFKTESFERIKVLGSPYGDFDDVAYHFEKKRTLKSLTKAPQNYMFIEVEE